MRKYLSGRYASMKFAWKGMKTMLRTQHNMRIHLFASIIVTGAGFIFHLSSGKWLALVITIAIVWITEAVNTAIEFLVDLVSPEYDPLAGHVKDIAAAAVLISALAAIIIGCIIFIPEVLRLFRG